MNTPTQPTPQPAGDAATAGGFDDVEKRLRARTFTQTDPDDDLLPDAIAEPATFHCNGMRYYRSRLDVDAADAIHALSVALASQIEITNTERAHAERAARAIQAGKGEPADIERQARELFAREFERDGIEFLPGEFRKPNSMLTMFEDRAIRAIKAALNGAGARGGS